MVFVSNPSTSIPAVLLIISNFGKISGYRVNLTKRLIFPINKKSRQISFNFSYFFFFSYPFRVVYDSFTYLGTTVTSNYKDLFKKNFKPLLDQTKSDLSNWSTLPILILSKWQFCPSFCFCFRLPVFIPKAYFKDLDQTISSFIWNKVVPRIRKGFLQRHKKDGGLAFQTSWIITGLPIYIRLDSGCLLQSANLYGHWWSGRQALWSVKLYVPHSLSARNISLIIQ